MARDRVTQSGCRYRDRPASPRWLRLFAAFALLAGCATLVDYPEPVRVTVSDIRVLEATMLEQVYAVTLRIQNPNPNPMEIRGGSFELAINGRDVGSGVTDAAATVPAFGDARIEIRTVSTLFGMLAVVRSFEDRRGDALDYDISGWLYLDDRLGRVRFRESGELTLPRAAGPASRG